MSLGDYVILGNTATVDIKAPLVEYVGDSLATTFLVKKITRFVRVLTYNLPTFYQSLTTQNADLDLSVPDGNGGSVSVSYGGGWTLLDASTSHIETGIFSEVRLQYQKTINSVFEFGLPAGLTVSVVSGIGYIKYNDNILESFNAGRGGEWGINSFLTAYITVPNKSALFSGNAIFGEKVLGNYQNTSRTDDSGVTIINEISNSDTTQFVADWISAGQYKQDLYGFNLTCCGYNVTSTQQTASDIISTDDMELSFQYQKSVRQANCKTEDDKANWSLGDNDENYFTVQESSEYEDDENVKALVTSKLNESSWILDIQNMEIISRTENEYSSRNYYAIYRSDWGLGTASFVYAYITKRVFSTVRIKARISYYDQSKAIRLNSYIFENDEFNYAERRFIYEWSREGNTIYLKAGDLILRQYDVTGLDP